MAVRYYDEAISKKIQNWVGDPNLRVLKPDETERLFSIRADETGDAKLKLPIVSISRGRDIEILSTKKQPRTFDGFTLQQNEKVSISINVVPITIKYQIDIYAKTMAEADEYVRNFVFNLINYPIVEVELPYNGLTVRHKSNILMDQTITDNSDIAEHMFPDQFTRFTLGVTIVDAYLFSEPTIQNSTLEYGFELRD